MFGTAKMDGPAQAMLALELTQRAMTCPAAQEAVPDPGLPAGAISEAKRQRFLEAILDERKCSTALTRNLSQVLGRRRPSPWPAA